MALKWTLLRTPTMFQNSMKTFVSFFLFFLVPRIGLAGTCCLGAGPKSFIQMKDLESYQVGFSSSVRDVYGRYDAYGDLVQAEKNQTYNLSLGAGIKLYEGIDAYTTIPWVYQIKKAGGGDRSHASVGDILAGTRVLLLRSLFRDEWYPTIYVNAGLKFPTGSVEALAPNGAIQPGTGNGVWEPFLGIALQKDYQFIILGLNATYTRRFSRTVQNEGTGSLSVKEGDKFELSETGTIPLSQRLSIAFGANQAWELSRQINDSNVADSSTRAISVFLSSNYFLTRYWALSGGFEFAVPIARFGVNQQAARSLTVTSTYAFY